MRNVHVPIFVALISVCIVQQGCRASALSAGEESYSRGKYLEAKTYFDSAVSANPQNAVAHYLLANVLIKLNKPAEAIKHYEAAVRLKPDQQEGRFSQQALLDLRGGVNQSGTATTRKVAADDTSHHELQESVTRISQATEAAKSDAEIVCAAKIKEITDESQQKVKRLEDDLKDYLYINRPRYLGKGGYYTPDNEPAKADYAARIAIVQKDARKRIDEVQMFYKQREIAMEDSALSLDQTYHNGANRGNVRLNPRGSSLFIRNYETEHDPSGDPLPVISQPKALVMKKTTHK